MTPKKYKEIEVEWIKWRKRPSKPESFTNHKEAIEFAYYHATKIKKKHKALAKISDMQEQQIKELKEYTTEINNIALKLRSDWSNPKNQIKVILSLCKQALKK